MRKGLIALAVLLAVPAAALAHPESGLLPDAVAEVEYKIVLDLNPGDTETRNKLGVVLLRKQRPAEAEAEFSKVLEASPENFDALDGLGLAKLMQGKHKEAAGWFRKAISVREADTMVHYHLGLVHEGEGRLADAEKAYLRALEVSRARIMEGTEREAELAKTDFLSAVLGNLYARKSE